MKGLSNNTVQFLLDNGFELKEYEEQNLTFYSKEISEEESLKKLMEFYYDVEVDETFSKDGVSFVMEIQTNGQTPQWTFTGTSEKFEILKDENAFVDYVEQIQNVLNQEIN